MEWIRKKTIDKQEIIVAQPRITEKLEKLKAEIRIDLAEKFRQ